MDIYKIDNYNRDSDGKPFPWYYHLENAELSELVKKIVFAFSIQMNTTIELIIQKICDKTHLLLDNNGSYFNATNEYFQISDVFDLIGVKDQDTIYISWGPGEPCLCSDVDLLYIKDVLKHFNDLWYPGTDDMVMFNDSFSFIIWIDHGGGIHYNKN